MIELPWRRSKSINSSLPRYLILFAVRKLTQLAEKPPPSRPFKVRTQELYSLIKASGDRRSISAVRIAHAHLIVSHEQLVSSVFLQNNLLGAYFECGSTDDARRVFQSIPSLNVTSWNMMITGYSKCGLPHHARRLFDEMPHRDSASWNTLMSGYIWNGMPEETIKTFISMVRDSDAAPDMFTFTCGLKACGTLEHFEFGLQIHSIANKSAVMAHMQVKGSLLDMYLKCGAIDLAEKLFNQIENPNLFCQNCMLLGCSMLYGVNGALELFYKMPERDTVTWNTIIAALCQNGHSNVAHPMLIEMRKQGHVPDSITYSSILGACAGISDLTFGRILHVRIIRTLPSVDAFVGTALVDMYTKSGLPRDAMRSFLSISTPNTASWTALIASFAEFGHTEEAFQVFNEMRAIPVSFDHFTFSTLLASCLKAEAVHVVSQLHSLSVRTGYLSCIPVSNALINIYSKCEAIESAELIFHSMPVRDIITWTSMVCAHSLRGDIEKARKFFDGMTNRNVVTWNALLSTYIQHGFPEEGLKMYILMLRENKVEQDSITFSTLLCACADLASWVIGSQIVAHTVKMGVNSHTQVANGILTTYSKCGRISEAHAVFGSIKNKDLVSWNAMIVAYAQNGRGREVVEMFERMLLEGLKPDYISYVALLSGCSHSGLVTQGRHYFQLMSEFHKISPGLEHFASMVDLLSRAGQLQEAMEMVETMPVSPSAEIWGALLGACRTHGNIKLAEEAARHLFEMDLKDSGNYVLLGKLYSDSGKSDNVSRLRNLMRKRGIRKNPGCSWIEVESRVHVFTADDCSHPQILDVLEMLQKLVKEVEGVEFVNRANTEPKSK